MRIDLMVPYAQKDAAKALGAKWDPEKQVWYVVNPPRLDRFMKWIKNPVHLKPSSLPDEPKKFKRPTSEFILAKREMKIEKLKKKIYKPSAAVATGPKVFKPLCQCDALPWKDCEHTEALANAAMHEMLDTVL